MTCVGAFGKMRDVLGIPIIPFDDRLRFLRQTRFGSILLQSLLEKLVHLRGNSLRVTLSPEGAQHGWKSEIQIPNQITWEPFFCQELDWILCDTIKRHAFERQCGQNRNFASSCDSRRRTKDMFHYLKKQVRFKAGLEGALARAEFPVAGAFNEEELGTIEDAQIMTTIREEVLKGAYYLIDYRGYAAA